jgi:hypothetical protein
MSKKKDRPTIVVLCGSTRFGEQFRRANLEETLAGKIVLTVGCDMRSDEAVFHGFSADALAAVKTQLDALHLHKIRLADEALILNYHGCIGPSTANELAYARSLGKTIRFLEPERNNE